MPQSNVPPGFILTLESAAQSLQSVDLWCTTGLSSDAPGSPLGKVQRHKHLYAIDASQK